MTQQVGQKAACNKFSSRHVATNYQTKKVNNEHPSSGCHAIGECKFFNASQLAEKLEHQTNSSSSSQKVTGRSRQVAVEKRPKLECDGGESSVYAASDVAGDTSATRGDNNKFAEPAQASNFPLIG